MKRLLLSVCLGLVAILSVGSVALAISNPTTISFGNNGVYPSYKVFYNVHETGDMMFMAEGYVYYASTPTDYSASQAFLFEIVSVNGTSVLISTAIAGFGDRPIGIYLTANQTASLGIHVGDAIGMRITGNPLIFASPTGNTVTAFLTGSQYVDQSVATASANPLAIFAINMARNMQVVDGVTTYITSVLGQYYLTTTGGNLFLEGIPGLDTLCPIAFQAGAQTLNSNAPSGTGAGTVNMTILKSFGATTDKGVKALGAWMGVGESNGGAVLLLIAVIGLGAFLFQRTGSPYAVIALIVVAPFVGAYLGFINLAAVLTMAFIIVVVGLFYFFTRGIL